MPDATKSQSELATQSFSMLDILKEDDQGHTHKILTGKKCAYCMDCGQILIEYKNKKDFYRLMNPIRGIDYD